MPRISLNAARRVQCGDWPLPPKLCFLSQAVQKGDALEAVSYPSLTPPTSAAILPLDGNGHFSVETARNMFYRCRFRQLLNLLESTGRRDDSGAFIQPMNSELLQLKANALFELHRIPEALALLKHCHENHSDDEQSLYGAARFYYCDNNMDAARATFQKIYDSTDSELHRFRSLLGIANVCYSLGEFAKIPKLIEELCSFEPLEKDDDRISLMIFLGNYYLASEISTALAKSYYTKALAASSARGWTYFITRSLYGLANIANKTEQQQELIATLHILRAFVDEQELVYFSFLVNERFSGHFSIELPMEFDRENRRVMVSNHWVALHDRPLLFQFLEILHQARDFVSKDQIARHLWPNEEYKPRVHDPRIFDIAKRSRAVIEAYENQPVVLLSGRLGFKLACH